MRAGEGPRITSGPFGTLPDGRRVELLTLTNTHGMEVRVSEYGGTVVSIRTPDRHGRFANVTLGCSTLEEYLRDASYLGALVGRYANRIAHGRFTLEGREHQLTRNDGPHHLHGGHRGFAKVLWRAVPFEQRGVAGAVLSHTSPDGEDGYPGTLDAAVRVTLTDDNALCFDFRATTDRATPVNCTQHSYFNLAGPGAGAGAGAGQDILGHRLTLRASRFTPVDATLIPTGELRAVRGTPFDFTQPVAIGDRIGNLDEQLGHGRGFDHNFVLDPAGADIPAARLTHPASGRVLEVCTTQPGLQFYSGNHLAHRALALEAQHFPDAPNHPEFPATVLRPGQEYRERIVYRFSVEAAPQGGVR